MSITDQILEPATKNNGVLTGEMVVDAGFSRDSTYRRH